MPRIPRNIINKQPRIPLPLPLPAPTQRPVRLAALVDNLLEFRPDHLVGHVRVVGDEVVVDADPEEALLEPDGVVVGQVGHVGGVVGLQVGGEGFGVGDGEEADARGAGGPFGDAELFAEFGDGVGESWGGEEGEEGEEGGE